MNNLKMANDTKRLVGVNRLLGPAVCVAGLITTVAAQGATTDFSPRQAAVCWVFAEATQRPDIASRVDALVTAHHSHQATGGEIKNYMAYVRRHAAADRSGASYQFGRDGEQACSQLKVN